MSGIDFLPSNLIVTNGVMTGSTVLTSDVVDIRGFKQISLQGNYSGTPSGTFAIQVSLDYSATVPDSGTWTTLTESGFTNPSGSAGHSYVEFSTNAPWLRVTYTNSGSTGVLNLYASAKPI